MLGCSQKHRNSLNVLLMMAVLCCSLQCIRNFFPFYAQRLMCNNNFLTKTQAQDFIFAQSHYSFTSQESQSALHLFL